MTNSEYFKRDLWFFYNEIYLNDMMVYIPAVAITLKNFIYGVIAF